MIIREDIFINSTKEKVWSTFTDLTCWVNWNTVLKDVYSKEKSLTRGESLKCTLRPFFFTVKVELRIEEVAPYERIVWVAIKKGLKARHEFLFEDNDNDNVFNAGVFIVKNCPLGLQFIKECIQYLKINCKGTAKKYDLNTEWAGMCYEQGIMNKLIDTKYKYYNGVITIPSYIINNTHCQ